MHVIVSRPHHEKEVTLQRTLNLLLALYCYLRYRIYEISEQKIHFLPYLFLVDTQHLPPLHHNSSIDNNGIHSRPIASENKMAFQHALPFFLGLFEERRKHHVLLQIKK